MGRVAQSTTIDAGPEAVFAYLADVTRHGEWSDVPLRVEQTSEGPVGQGATFTSVGRQLGRDFAAELTVTEYASNTRLAYEAKGDAFHFRHDFELREEDGGTRLVKGTEPLRLSFPFSLFAPLLSTFILPRGLRGDLQRIKEKLEAS